jgi:hypothetical protein
MAKVVKLLHKDVPPGNLADFGSTWMQHLRVFIHGQVRDYIMRGGKLGSLALKAGVGAQTLSRLAYYESIHPRASTIDGIIDALDLYEEVGKQMIAYGRSRNHK